MADTIVDAPPGFTKGGVKIGSVVDAPPGFKPDATPAAKPGKSMLQKLGDDAGAAYRNLQATRTWAARDPGGALGAVLGAPQGMVAGAVMAPQRLKGADANDLSKVVPAIGRGAFLGATNPVERNRYNQEGRQLVFGDAPKNPIALGAQDLAFQTVADPVTHGGRKAASMLVGAGGAGARAAAGAVKPLGNYVNEVREAAKSPLIAPGVAALSHLISKITTPVRFGVNTGKELMFLNPLPHGLGNMTTLNYLANGPGTALKGLYYGARGAPRATVQTLKDINAGAFTPELTEGAHSHGLISKVGRLPVPAALRAGAGGVAGGLGANQTAPTTDTPDKRLKRTVEGALLGVITGAAPEVLNVSNHLMSRLETGHRAAMLEKLVKEAKDAATGPKAKMTLEEAQAYYKDVTTRMAGQLNEAFGGGEKGWVAKIASALGGPFAQWQAEVVPRAVGSALAKNPARVEAIARTQDITNRDVLAKQPYQMQVGGPVGGAAEMAFNPKKYGTRLLGPLGNINPSEDTDPKSFSLGDALKGETYNAVPGREVVGPFFGDTLYPSKAPAIPAASLSTALGWNLKNRTPVTDAINNLMRTTGLDRETVTRLYYRNR